MFPTWSLMNVYSSPLNAYLTMSSPDSRNLGPLDPNDELKPLPGDKARVVPYGTVIGAQTQGQNSVSEGGSGSNRTRTREERIGVQN